MKNIIFSLIICISVMAIPKKSHPQWILANSGTTANLNSVAASDEGYLVCGGWIGSVDDGMIIRSEDSGETWSLVFTANGSVTHIDAFWNVGYAVTDKGYIYKSDDNGQTWNFNFWLVDYKFRTVFIKSPESIFAGGQAELVFESVNQGQSWNQIPYITGPGYWIRNVSFHNNRIGYIVGDGGRAYCSPNYGYGWFLMNTKTTSNLTGVSVPSEDTAYICGLNGTILKTTDGGISWANISTTTSGNIGIFFLTNLEGYVAQANGKIGHTVDGGENWEFQQTITTSPLREFCYLQEINRLLICGDGGIILYNDLSTGITKKENSRKLDSHIQVQPNPVKDFATFKIKDIEIQQNAFTIYSADSKIIEIHKNVRNGDMVVDLSELASGVYYFTLTANNRVIDSGNFIKE